MLVIWNIDSSGFLHNFRSVFFEDASLRINLLTVTMKSNMKFNVSLNISMCYMVDLPNYSASLRVASVSLFVFLDHPIFLLSPTQADTFRFSKNVYIVFHMISF